MRRASTAPVEPRRSASCARICAASASGSCASSISRHWRGRARRLRDSIPATCERLGATLVEVDLPTAEYGIATYYLIAPAECSSNLARFDGMRYGLRVDGADVGATYEATRAAGFGDEVKRRILIGTHALSSGYYDAYYVRAQKARTLIAADFARAFERCDVIANPGGRDARVRFNAKKDPVQHVPHGLLHDSDVACGPAVALRPLRLRVARRGRHAAYRSASNSRGPFRRRAVLGCGHAYERATRHAEHTPHSGARRRSGAMSMHRTYEAVIGIECHVELKTETQDVLRLPQRVRRRAEHARLSRVFGDAGCASGAESRRRSSTFFVPGLAFGAAIPAYAKFDRKNYFYPDMPKDYQISQFDLPFTQGGVVAFWSPDGTQETCRLTRIHLEEDTGKSSHAGSRDGRLAGSTHSLVDFNRAGVPLMECVSEPELRSAAEAVAFLEALKRTFIMLGVSDVKMEEGSLRCDANVSIRPVGTTELGTKTEIKNMNSFASVRRAIEHEVARQTRDPSCGGRIEQATLGWNEAEQTTHLAAQQRTSARLSLLSRSRSSAVRMGAGIRRALTRRARTDSASCSCDRMIETDAALRRAGAPAHRYAGACRLLRSARERVGCAASARELSSWAIFRDLRTRRGPPSRVPLHA